MRIGRLHGALRQGQIPVGADAAGDHRLARGVELNDHGLGDLVLWQPVQIQRERSSNPMIRVGLALGALQDHRQQQLGAHGRAHVQDRAGAAHQPHARRVRRPSPRHPIGKTRQQSQGQRAMIG